MPSNTHSYDLVSVGGGLAGLAAAVAGADAGMSVLVVEKTTLLGGVTADSNGQLWVPASHLALSAGFEDSSSACAGYLRRLGMGFADERLIDAYSRLAPAVVRYCEKLTRVRWRLLAGLADYYFPDFEDARAGGRYLEVEPYPGASLGTWRGLLRESLHVPYRLTHEEMWTAAGDSDALAALARRRADEDMLCLGTGLAASFVAGAAACGAELRLGVRVSRLLAEDGRVTGLELEDGTERVRIHARRGVVLATGGYDWNPAAVEEFEGQLEVRSAADPAIEGDHLRLAGELGAALRLAPMPVRLGYRLPGPTGNGSPWRILGAVGLPHAILVDGHGRRFCNESFYPSIAHALRTVDGYAQSFAHWPCHMVFDAQFRERYTMGPVGPADPFPAEWNVVEAADLPGLAAATGHPPTALVDTVERFNDACRSGVDEDFRRGERPWERHAYGDRDRGGNPNLGTIEQPPFFAFRPQLIGTGLATAGLATDSCARVLDPRGRPIAGLYAAGNASASAETGPGYQSGIANTRGLIYGCAAAMHAAGRTLESMVV